MLEAAVDPRVLDARVSDSMEMKGWDRRDGLDHQLTERSFLLEVFGSHELSDHPFLHFF